MAELGAAAGAAAGADAGAAAGGDAAAGAGGGCYCPENLAEERESKLAIDVFEKLKVPRAQGPTRGGGGGVGRRGWRASRGSWWHCVRRPYFQAALPLLGTPGGEYGSAF